MPRMETSLTNPDFSHSIKSEPSMSVRQAWMHRPLRTEKANQLMHTRTPMHRKGAKTGIDSCSSPSPASHRDKKFGTSPESLALVCDGPLPPNCAMAGVSCFDAGRCHGRREPEKTALAHAMQALLRRLPSLPRKMTLCKTGV